MQTAMDSEADRTRLFDSTKAVRSFVSATSLSDLAASQNSIINPTTNKIADILFARANRPPRKAADEVMPSKSRFSGMTTNKKAAENFRGPGKTN
jgi:hypothetical protein